MPNIKYPSLFNAADKLSLKAQKRFLRLTGLHSFLLILGTAMAINIIPNKGYSLMMAIVFILALGLSVYLGLMKLEKAWYNGRAVAESVKTATWRYCMRAAPFVDARSIQQPNAEFRNMLESILRSNHDLGGQLSEAEDTSEQISNEMKSIRELSLEARVNYYLEFRIDEQRSWYAKKAKENKTKHTIWFGLLVTFQLLAVMCVLARIAYPDWKFWPTDTFVVIAACAVSWMQIKKFTELAAAYSLTAQEIGIIKGRSENIQCEESLSTFVNHAEVAFSREHTQWSARQ
ncbi:DUF4231 domain-containing protein [Vibrio campbellii]|uniref:DUF4231 domain-containing protein n=1 Tax=Vibrio campbellii TaxID=680 RepID=UPI00168D7680|nr:DUF4231 domain-containing protein [Vibrio campbellii]